MSAAVASGRVYRCELCGAEVTTIATAAGEFAPVCCNRAMELTDLRVPFWVCPKCGAEVILVSTHGGAMELLCCGVPMELRAA